MIYDYEDIEAQPPSEFSETDEEEKDHRLAMTERGRRMAYAIGECMLMKYFFGKEWLKDKKKITYIKQAFLNDMNFNLCTGKVIKSTLRFGNRHLLADVISFFENNK